MTRKKSNNLDGYTIIEREDTGRVRRTRIVDSKAITLSDSAGHLNRTHTHVIDFLKKVFLPSGYPDSVSPDYLRYQIFNALQAFCSSLASLLSSRAVLEGFGVGDPSATATHALLLTVLQDIFSRLTTIFAAYAIGSSLVPEAKTYRLLADILNDAAIILDTLSPLLISPALPFHIPGLRVTALCLSASLRALCGIAAGGSKAAITLHFATPISGVGDVGDLNAKDSSKETVLALFGMLLGTLIVPHLTTPLSTYSALFILVASHLAINYLGVRGLALRSLNRQRLAITWNAYRSSTKNPKIPTPADVSKIEAVLGHPALFRDTISGRITGHCTIGSSLSDRFRGPVPSRLFELFDQERYLLWYDHQCLRTSGDGQRVRGLPRLHIFLKDGCTSTDQLKAWIHAAELCRMAALGRSRVTDPSDDGADQALSLVRTTLQHTLRHLPDFIKDMRASGWNTGDVALMAGSPRTVLTGIKGPHEGGTGEEDKKLR